MSPVVEQERKKRKKYALRACDLSVVGNKKKKKIEERIPLGKREHCCSVQKLPLEDMCQPEKCCRDRCVPLEEHFFNN